MESCCVHQRIKQCLPHKDAIRISLNNEKMLRWFSVQCFIVPLGEIWLAQVSNNSTHKQYNNKSNKDVFCIGLDKVKHEQKVAP